MNSPPRFLLVRTGALGDIVHGLPVAAALKKRFPGCRVDWLAGSHYIEWLSCVPHVDNVIGVSFKRVLRSILGRRDRRAWASRCRQLRRGSYDIAVDLQGMIRSGVLCLGSGAPFRLGFSPEHCREGASSLFSTHHPSDVPHRCHVIDSYLSLLHPLGVRETALSFAYEIPDAVKQGVRRYVTDAAPGKDRLRIAVHPVTAWSTKNWSLQRFAALIDRLTGEAPAREVFLLWGPGEEAVVARLQEMAKGDVHLLPPMGLVELTAFLGECDLYVGGDSGPMHLACSLEVPVLALFGPTDPVRNGPFRGEFRVVRSFTPCGPCYRRRCARRDCMDAISVDDVWDSFCSLEYTVMNQKNRR